MPFRLHKRDMMPGLYRSLSPWAGIKRVNSE